MDLDKAVDYLPKMPYSCDVGFETVSCFQDVLHKDHTFRKFEMFEAYLENNGEFLLFIFDSWQIHYYSFQYLS